MARRAMPYATTPMIVLSTGFSLLVTALIALSVRPVLPSSAQRTNV
jgi:hypothetical protein